MPGRLFLERPLPDIADHLGAGLSDLTDIPRSNIAPGEMIVAALPGQPLTHARWGIIPVGRVNARGRPVMETIVNARSETVFEKSAFEGVRRCLIPADGWYEWTGEKRRKQAWRITRKSRDPVVFAGIFDVWSAPNGTEILQVAPLTCEPNNDVRPIHHRMGVILEPSQFDTWLSGDQDRAAQLLQPLPDGLLKIEKADDVDWTAA